MSVYLRDASMTSDRAPIRWHWRHPNYATLSACGRAWIIVDDPYAPEEIPDDERCRASGCRQRWADWKWEAGL